MTIELTASVIVPVAITDAMLTSCTVAEPAAGETAWVSGATYAIGDIRIRTETHKRYKRITAGAGTTAPESDAVNWLDIGATNRWSQFDEKIGTLTNTTGTLTTVLKPGSVEGLALLDMVGTTATISVKDAPGGTVVYSRSVDLDGSIVTSVYDWMYIPIEQRINLALTDLPGQYPGCEVTVTLTSASTVSLGVLAVGRVQTIGSTQYGAGAGIINWGKVTDDGFGNRTWLEGDWSDRVTLPLIMNRSDFTRVHRQLARLRSTPSIYIGTELSGFDPLVCYGVFKDLYITVDNFPTCSLNLEIEGMNNI